MSSVTLLPFNFQPVSTFTSNNYTVAAGLYAHATPLSMQCTLNGTDFSVNSTTSGTLTAGTNYLLASANFTGRIRSSASSTAKQLSYGASSVIVTASGTTRIDAYFHNGTLIQVAEGTYQLGAAGDSSTGIHYQHTTATGTVTVTHFDLKPCWVKATDVLAGGIWLVTTYNQLT